LSHVGNARTACASGIDKGKLTMSQWLLPRPAKRIGNSVPLSLARRRSLQCWAAEVVSQLAEIAVANLRLEVEDFLTKI